MQMCQAHWDEIRKAVADRGMDHLVSKSGKEVADKMLRATDTHSQTKENYDPLMDIHNNLVCAAMKAVGLSILSDEGCPLCTCNILSGKETLATEWINSCSDYIMNMCLEKKFITTQ